VGFDLVTELKALRADEGKRLSKATYAFDQVDGAVQAALRRLSRKDVQP
jgi:predicted hydrolase (HD superfamily)